MRRYQISLNGGGSYNNLRAEPPSGGHQAINVAITVKYAMQRAFFQDLGVVGSHSLPRMVKKLRQASDQDENWSVSSLDENCRLMLDRTKADQYYWQCFGQGIIKELKYLRENI